MLITRFRFFAASAMMPRQMPRFCFSLPTRRVAATTLRYSAAGFFAYMP